MDNFCHSMNWRAWKAGRSGVEMFKLSLEFQPEVGNAPGRLGLRWRYPGWGGNSKLRVDMFKLRLEFQREVGSAPGAGWGRGGDFQAGVGIPS